jgi:hypothetical protein
MKCNNCGASLTSPTGGTLTICTFCKTYNGETALREEFLRRGEALYKDKKLLEALLSDFFAENPKLLKFLRLAVQDNIPLKIFELAKKNITEQKIQLASMVSYFAGEDINKARADEVVRILAFAAGLEEEVLEVLAVTDAKISSLHNPPTETNITFGGYIWRVLDVKEGRWLIITDNIIDQLRFDPRQNEWIKCELRIHLNGKFYDDSFKSHEKNRILSNNDTGDKIFLLSVGEAKKFFEDDDDRKATYKGDAVRWWLRSPCRYSLRAPIVDRDGNAGILGDYVTNGSGGVRPALWLNM